LEGGYGLAANCGLNKDIALGDYNDNILYYYQEL
jgi:hypothetical protein